MNGENTPSSQAFLSKALHAGLVKGEDKKQEIARLRNLSDGLGWIKSIIDREQEQQMTSRLLTLKLLYAGYFGSRGRSTRYARNPCAVREALKYCRENHIPPPDWTLKYIYDLMSGEETPPTERDEKRWANLIRLLEIAAEWDKKSQQGLTDREIEKHFRRKGISDTPLQYARAFLDPRAKQVVSDVDDNRNTGRYIDTGLAQPPSATDEAPDSPTENSEAKKTTETIEGEPI